LHHSIQAFSISVFSWIRLESRVLLQAYGIA